MVYKKISLRILLKCLILIFSQFFITIYSQANTQKKQKVLYLNSYHIGSGWADEVTSGVKSLFDTINNIDLYIEYLDTKRKLDSAYFKGLLDLYHLKYAKINFDIIICSDNNALDFVVKYRDDNMLNVPVVFCGISNPDDYKSVNEIFGVEESIDYKAQINIILETLPGVKHIYIVLENTVTGNIYKKNFELLSDEKQDLVKLNFIEEIDLLTLPEVVSNLPVNSAILYFDVNLDKYGNIVKPNHVAEIIVDNAHVPVYADIIGLDVEGILGGVKSLGNEQGEEAAKIALKILNNEPSNNVPRLVSPGIQFIFDYNMIKKLDLDINNFPKNSSYINHPDNIFKRYKKQILSFIIIISVLVLIIAILSSYILVKRKVVKELKNAKEKAEESDRLKSSFLANVSHEIRTPLNSIIGFNTIIAEKFKFDSEAKTYYTYILNACDGLSNLVHDLIEISKIDSGLMEIKLKSTDINLQLNEINKTFSENMKVLNGNKLDFDNSSDKTPLYFRTDPKRFKQVFSNLIKNALKFTENGKVNFGYKKNEEDLIFYVKDNGIGIQPDKREFIFGKFNKIEKKNKLYRGAGLGLALTRSIIKLLNGKIWVESMEGQGAVFYFTLSSGNQ